MKVTLKEWNAVATWRWDMPEDEVCGICRVQFDGTCPTCKFPGDDCSLLLGKCGHSFHMTPSAMSLPKLASSPSLSSSPLKQSIRRSSSRPHSIDQIAQTNDTLDDHPSPAANVQSHLAEENDQIHQEVSPPSHILPQPFFTLIEDAHTSEYYHPTVHYIFSDDDTDIVTEAALRSLESEQDAFPNAKGKGKPAQENPHQQSMDQDAQEAYEADSPTRKESFLPDAIPGVRENYIILDIDHIPIAQEPDHGIVGSPESQTQSHAPAQAQAQAQQDKQSQQQDQPLPPPPQPFTITSSHSLSPSWQVLKTNLLPAPTFENDSSGEKPQNGGLMLQIRGTSGLPMGMVGKDKERGSQRLEDMMDQFARRLDELKQVIECGEQGMPAVIEGSFHDVEHLEGSHTQLPDIPHETGPAELHGEEDVVPGYQYRGA
ncbi:anaphase-promoting complex subunit 11 RING-H2 finger-domain-containing protein [Aspergillus cavernicola]|uniref:Anaphase-promoting complex subunit 11 RING-H2 finger-domain-containing protein n=1 Tax=Aspergillus cavernicola TaxID=176166 RepID=A0ABR4I6U4_9EURO